jgi:hypothetical protein
MGKIIKLAQDFGQRLFLMAGIILNIKFFLLAIP